jgi:hypothetical protein
VEFRGDFSNSIKNLSTQVVFKISDSDENILIAELLNEKKEYVLELPTNYKLLSWTMKRIISQYDNVNYESALVTMEWAWKGEIEDGDGVNIHESELQWAWHPYEPEP